MRLDIVEGFLASTSQRGVHRAPRFGMIQKLLVSILFVLWLFVIAA